MTARTRPGLLSCSCDFDLTDDLEHDTLTFFFARGWLRQASDSSVLAQALAFPALPLSGRMLAASPAAATAPVVMMLAGAAASTFPASILTGLFGRRSAFALGASLGVAGAAIGSWSIASGQFAGLCLGAFWIGAAQGFGLFYRHTVGASARAAAIVLGAGALAAFAAPCVVAVAQHVAGLPAPAGALIGAGLAQPCVLSAASLTTGVKPKGQVARDSHRPGFDPARLHRNQGTRPRSPGRA